MSVHVFAYGSNLCIQRIAVRVASATPVLVARLAAHELRFHKRGRDGSAKADAFFTGCEEDSVWGVVYALDRADKRRLDGYEGLGRGYLEREVELVGIDGEPTSAWVYRAHPEQIDGGLKPFTWYRSLVLAGARQHRLASAYVAAIEAVEAVEDLDRTRHLREMSVLEALAAP